MSAPFRPSQDDCEAREGALDPALLAIIEALAEAQAGRDYAARHPTPEA